MLTCFTSLLMLYFLIRPLGWIVRARFRARSRTCCRHYGRQRPLGEKTRFESGLKGHKAGIEAVRETIRCASDTGVRYLTIYSFSTENWKRPEEEVTGLMGLFAKTMLAEVDGLHEENVRVRTIGDLSEACPKKPAKRSTRPGKRPWTTMA